MNPLKICFPILALCSVAFAQSNYQDHPAQLDAKDAAIINSYIGQAKKTLPHFDAELLKPKGRTFYVITEIHGDKTSEQIFVKVKSKKEDGYHGTIDSDPEGSVKFKKSEALVVNEKDVLDWCIVSPKGEEEGNLMGKAGDALMAKVLAFVIEVKSQKGVFSSFRVVSVTNRQTKQNVREIVPADVIDRVEKRAAELQSHLKLPDDTYRSIILVAFPSWEIVKD